MRRVAAVLVAAIVAGCSADRSAADAVRAYDDALVRAYAGGDASRMTEVATKKEAERVLVLVDLKSMNRLALESTIERFEVLSAQARGDRATVDTSERWRYHDRPLDPGHGPGPNVLSEMKMRYDLVKEGGRWKVAEVTTLANTVLEPKGYRIGGEAAGAKSRP